MIWKNTQGTYGSVTKTLHWLIALLVIGMLIFGFVLGNMPNSPMKGTLIDLHKSVGLTILLLMIIRLCWRFINLQPMLPITVPLWEQIAARTVHVFLYILLFAMPLSGWVMSSLGGHPVIFWSWLNVTLPFTQNKALADYFFDAHTTFAWIIIALLVLHVGAALKHHFLEKNNVLKRMLPGYKSPNIFGE